MSLLIQPGKEVEKMKKRYLAVVLTLCLLMSFGTAAFASGIMPLWNSTQDCTVELTCSSNNASCKLDVSGMSASDKITATVTLQQENARGSYINVQRWAGLTGTGSLHFSEDYPISAGGDYRLKAEVQVVGSNGTDNITQYAY